MDSLDLIEPRKDQEDEEEESGREEEFGVRGDTFFPEGLITKYHETPREISGIPEAYGDLECHDVHDSSESPKSPESPGETKIPDDDDGQIDPAEFEEWLTKCEEKKLNLKDIHRLESILEYQGQNPHLHRDLVSLEVIKERSASHLCDLSKNPIPPSDCFLEVRLNQSDGILCATYSIDSFLMYIEYLYQHLPGANLIDPIVGLVYNDSDIIRMFQYATRSGKHPEANRIELMYYRSRPKQRHYFPSSPRDHPESEEIEVQTILDRIPSASTLESTLKSTVSVFPDEETKDDFKFSENVDPHDGNPGTEEKDTENILDTIKRDTILSLAKYTNVPIQVLEKLCPGCLQIMILGCDFTKNEQHHHHYPYY